MFRLKEFQRLLVLSCLCQTVHGSRIINGDKAPVNSMQYMVSVQSNGSHACGGFLIREDFVVTAAHCNTPKPNPVVLGNQNIKSSDIKTINIEYSCVFPTFQKVGLGNDIMLLKLSGKAPLNNRVKIIPLPTSSNANLEGQNCSVAGWGKTETNHFTVDDLRVVNVSILNSHLCREIWGGLPPNVICAGGYNTTKGFCQGDSGGPLVCDGVAVGVVSFNRKSNCNYPADVPNVYTDISKYLEWINNIMKTKKCV